MAAEIATQQTGLSGSTLYATLDSGGRRWNGTAFEAVTLADWSTYVVALAEATGTGYFTADRPTGIPAGAYLVVTIYRRAGGSPAATDPVVASGAIGDPTLSFLAAATSGSVTLAAGDPDYSSTGLIGSRIYITGGAQGGTVATFTGDPSAGVATVDAWTRGTPAAGSPYAILPPGGSVSGNVTVGGYATGQDPATLTWAAGTRSLTDKAGFALATAPPTASAITTAVVAGMATAPVGSVANISPVTFPSGTVSASPTPTSTGFTATGTLNAVANAYAPTTKKVRFVWWLTGANAGETSSIATYPGSGAFTLDFAPTGTIAAGDTFFVF